MHDISAQTNNEKEFSKSEMWEEGFIFAATFQFLQRDLETMHKRLAYKKVEKLMGGPAFPRLLFEVSEKVMCTNDGTWCRTNVHKRRLIM